MTLRKIVIDNSVEYIPRSEQTRYNKPNTKINNSLSREQNKKLSQNKKKLVEKNFTGSGFAIRK